MTPFSELTRAAVAAPACQLPAATRVPLSRWPGPELPAAAKATMILDLYQGRRLRPGGRIVSADAGPPTQARSRCRPAAPAATGITPPFNRKFTAAGLTGSPAGSAPTSTPPGNRLNYRRQPGTPTNLRCHPLSRPVGGTARL